MNQRIYNGKEADILIPDKHIAIEANGCYWHSEIFVDKLYHQDKKKLIEATGDSLISIYEFKRFLQNIWFGKYIV